MKVLASSLQPADTLQRHTTMKQALIALEPSYRRVLVLRFFYRLSTQQVALTLQCSEASVKTLQHQALAALHSQVR